MSKLNIDKAGSIYRTNTEFFNEKVSASMADIEISIDHYKTDLYSFLYANLIFGDVDHISLEDAEKVIALEPGEITFIGLTEIRRIS